MENSLFAPLMDSAELNTIAQCARDKTPVAVYEVAEGMRAYLAACICAKTGRQVLLVAPNEVAAMRLSDDCAQLLGGERVGVLPAQEIRFLRATASRDTLWQRLSVLYRVATGETRLLVASADALLCRMMPHKAFERAAVDVCVGQRMGQDELMNRLVLQGYERVDMVEGKGQCARRGAIVDVYPPSESNALRVEFFDDEIDGIREFDCISQRSLQKRQNALLTPAAEWLLSEPERNEAADKMLRALREHVGSVAAPEYDPDLPPMPDDDAPAYADASDKPGARVLQAGYQADFIDAEALRQGLLPRNINAWAGVLFDKYETLDEWLDDPLVIIDTPERVRQRCVDRDMGFTEDFKLALEKQEAVPAQCGALIPYEDALTALLRRSVVTLQEMLRGMAGFAPKKIVKLAGAGSAGYQGRLKELASDVSVWQKEGYAVALLSGGVARGSRLQTTLSDLGLPLPFEQDAYEFTRGQCVILPVTLSHGFVMHEQKIALIADSDIFGAGYKKARKRRTTGEKLEAFTDLHEGDYVVHETHGVGIFRGTVRLQSEGTYRDYLYIQYQGNDKLYIPTEQFDRVQKFIGGTDAPPPLNRLGGGEWEKKKARVKASLQKLAFSLVQLYAERKSTPGHAFCADTPWQRELEDRFPYELTPDQARAVSDVTRDMERPENMDRLICGDVGYGKTEVAMRAAFKAVMDGKQVALLAPTTILAQQHYNTLKKRFEGFPVTVDVVSRFRTPSGIKEALAGALSGRTDVLVGTHRLLSKDVRFKDLGLLVVDEEQRFGVSHKESIKNIKKTVDVLTLSATPIPRTLHMSMVGVRDMSLLETPPEARFPVQTYVMDYSDGVIRDAILRELSRQGQVYFLYNSVSHIDAFHARLKALVPEARIAIGHGQMKEHALEDVMMDFYEGKYDVLLCTTIIENGLDVPRANTLIVFDADRFGLSQLYQLRGRVGRSNRLAYAYFTVRPDKMLSETAQKRLSAIREFTEFGSGFRIAMRDLEIRGAGNIFGPEQSGHVSTVGYDMYCRLIEEAVREAQGERGVPVQARADTRVELRLDAFLPSDYVRGEQQRMEIYKRIALIRCAADREDVLEELIDRFGDPPIQVVQLVEIAHLRGLCGRLNVTHVSAQAGVLVMKLDTSAHRDPSILYEAMQRAGGGFTLAAGKTPAMLYKKQLPLDKLVESAVRALEKLADAYESIRTPQEEQA